VKTCHDFYIWLQAQLQIGKPMKTREIHSSRLKTSLFLCLSVGLVALCVLGFGRPNQNVVGLGFLATVFGLGAVAMAYILIRPLRLILDEEGFTLAGGLFRAPKKILWRDIDHFFVLDLSADPFIQGVKAIAFNYKPGVPKNSVIGNRSDGRLPGFWPKGTEDMVDELNAYRLGDGRWEG
jgi:hypothetical protein